MTGAVKTGTRLRFGVFMATFWARIIFGNAALIFAQHIHPEPLFGMQVAMRSSTVVYADQHQHGIERYRGKSVRRHPMNLAIQVQRNDRNPGCKATHGLSKLCRIKGHRHRTTARFSERRNQLATRLHTD